MGKISASTHSELAHYSTKLLIGAFVSIMKSQCASLFIAQTIVFKSKRIRLDLDCTVAPSWCEIDAVQITGNWISPECAYVTFIDSDPNSKYLVYFRCLD